ncbi:MAG: hypothetical protein IJJ42_03045 [Clostridia bacterium]|nr:hypothetical protein [Clostridia bacterium]
MKKNLAKLLVLSMLISSVSVYGEGMPGTAEPAAPLSETTDQQSENTEPLSNSAEPQGESVEGGTAEKTEGEPAVFGIVYVKDNEKETPVPVTRQTLTVELYADETEAAGTAGETHQIKAAKSPKKAQAAKTGDQEKDAVAAEITVTGDLPEGARAAGWPAAFKPEADHELIGAYALTVLDAEGGKVDLTGLSVQMRFPDLEVGEKEEINVYAADGGRKEALDGSLTEDTVSFTADGSPVYAVTRHSLEKIIEAGDGNTYKITVTYDDNAGLPPDAELEVAVKENPEAYLEVSQNALNAEDISVIKAFDISIKDGEGTHWEPTEDVLVTIELLDTPSLTTPRIVHIPDGEGTEPEPIIPEVNNDVLSFRTESFSVYVVVEAPEPVSFGDTAVSTAELTGAHGQYGFYLSVTQGQAYDNYFTATVNGNGALTETTDINAAATWYFEKAGESANEFYIYTLVNNEKKYIQQKSAGSAEIKLSDSGTVFAASVAVSGLFYIKHAGEDMWLQHSGSGKGIRLYKSKDNTGNSRIKFTFIKPQESSEDPYGFDGKAYGIMNYTGTTSAYAMMAEMAKNNKGLKRQSMLIRSDPMDPNRTLYVAKNSSMPLWEIHHVSDDAYTLTYNGQYLRMDGTAVTLTETADAYCKLRIVPGTGNRAGKIQIIGVSANKALQMGDNNNGFAPAGVSNNNNQWHNFAALSVYDESDFIEYTAYKVGASDTVNVANGNQVVLYIRLWNEDKYVFYAIDHNGNLIPCYESGDTIVWIGAQINTVLWNFTEYYRPGTNVSNDYYDFQNSYSGLYLAPQIENGENIFSGTPFGVNLTGRSYGEYYTPILAWDDAHYDYAGLKAENGKLVTCPESETTTFYFAVMKRTEHELQPVATVDHSELGLTMKMVDCVNRAAQNSVLGSSEDHGNEARTTPNLLSKHIEEGAKYPITMGGNSLGNLYAQAMTVNHLFIQSIYEGSGYYQFDSSQNFAQLNKSTGDFSVYQELGAVNGSGTTRKHGQFMPYNTLRTDQAHPTNPSNLYDIYGNELPESDPRKYETLYGFNEPENHNFAMEIEGHFLMPPSGHDAWGHDIIFDFVGDDDFWLYVDGELVLDLGGIHKAVGGSVNYSTGAVNVNGTPTTLYNLFKANFKERKNITDDNDPELQAFLNSYFQDKTVNGTTHKVFTDYSTHTVRIFYMERGEGASNLRMRFNLAAITPGQVLLSKEITGTDKNDYAGAKFPFQIWYREEEETDFTLLTQQIMDTGRWQVVYRNTSRDVEHQEEAEIDGIQYRNVFYLMPGQTATIKLPGNTLHYYIKECGVDTSIYNHVYANADELTGTATGRENRKDFQTTEASVMKRASIVFRNEVDPEALRTLTVKIRLFDENDQELTQRSPGFTLRLYLGDALDYYKNGDYLVRNPAGEYCYYDSAAQAFTSTGKRNYSELTAAELQTTTFKTSPSGAVSKIPAGYSVEVRGLLADTKFKVTAEDYDNPVGYGKRTWTEGAITYTGYKRVIGSFITEGEENSGLIRDRDHPQIEVHFQHGWGIRAEKEWSDKDFMLSHDDVFFAVYVNDSFLPGSVHRVDAYNYTTYFFPKLEEGTSFEDYTVREAEVTDLVIASDGTVIGYSGITKKNTGETISLGGVDSSQNPVTDLTYIVSYTPGESQDGARTRTNIVTNTRVGGLKIQAEAQGSPLSGAVFILKKDEDTVGSYTSDGAGLVTDAYLEDGSYTLTQTRAPQGYRGMQEPISITVSGGSFTISGGESDAYTYYSETGMLTIHNKLFTLRAVKTDSSDTTITLEGAHFALYREVKGADGSMRMDYYPLSGYEDIVSGEQGVIAEINESLAPGGYYLTETQTVAEYQQAEEPVLFHISDTGAVSAEQGSGYIGRVETAEIGGVLQYTLLVPNTKEAMKTLTVIKAVGGAMGDTTKDFTFTLAGMDEDTQISWTKQEKAAENGAYADLAAGASGTETADGNGRISFTLKHWQKIKLTVPAGIELTLTEEHGNYTQTISGLEAATTTDVADVTDGKKFTLAGDDEVNFTNELAAVSPTGVTFRFAPYLMMLLAGCLLLAILRYFRYKREEYNSYH